MNHLAVKDFKWIRGVNDAEYIDLLLKVLDRQEKITAKAINKLREYVPVIRCRNCKFYGAFSISGKPTGKGWCDSCEKSVKEDWYCADGERKA